MTLKIGIRIALIFWKQSLICIDIDIDIADGKNDVWWWQYRDVDDITVKSKNTIQITKFDTNIWQQAFNNVTNIIIRILLVHLIQTSISQLSETGINWTIFKKNNIYETISFITFFDLKTDWELSHWEMYHFNYWCPDMIWCLFHIVWSQVFMCRNSA